MTQLVTDANGNPMPVINFKTDGAQQISIGSASTVNTTAFSSTTKVIFVHSDVAFYFALGDENVTATTSSHHMPANIGLFAIGLNAGQTHIAVIQDDEAGTLHISEL